MYYEIYADSLFFINMIMNLYLLILVNDHTFRTSSFRRLLLGAMVGAAFFIIPFFLKRYFLVAVLLAFVIGSIMMILIAFSVRSMQAFLMIVEKLFFYALCMGGSILLVHKLIPGKRNATQSVFVTILVGTMVLLVNKFWKSFHKSNTALWNATLVGWGKTMTVSALLDSGNSLIEPISRKPVCIIEKTVWEKWGIYPADGYRAIPYHSVGKKHGIMQGYLLPELRLENGGPVKKLKNVYIAVSNEHLSGGSDADIKMILNPMLFQKKEVEYDIESGISGENAI